MIPDSETDVLGFEVLLEHALQFSDGSMKQKKGWRGPDLQAVPSQSQGGTRSYLSQPRWLVLGHRAGAAGSREPGLVCWILWAEWPQSSHLASVAQFSYPRTAVNHCAYVTGWLWVLMI